MMVLVRLFAQAREAVGTSEMRVQLASSATVADALALLATRHPRLAPHLERSSFSINERHARRDEALAAGDEIGILPPIGGG